jgi:hypothetical protein
MYLTQRAIKGKQKLKKTAKVLKSINSNKLASYEKRILGELVINGL